MRYCAFLLLAASAAFGADFYTGQGARLLIGQTNFTSQDIPTQDPAQPNTLFASQTYLGAAGGVAYANDTLFVVDSNRVGATPVNNRVLIYRNISTQIPALRAEVPQGNGIRCPVCVATPNVVLGQKDFTTTDIAATATGMRGPQAVWIQGRQLLVADTQNHRVLIWNSIPTKSGQAADLVLGQKDMNSGFSPSADIILNPKADNLSNPVSVTSDGIRLYVSDLGHSRVLIWNSIPIQNGAPADIALGQPDLTSYTSNNSSKLCASNGTDTSGNLTYPDRCSTTLSFPRYALSDGRRLFVADGGNDRVLVYNSIPTQAGQAADIVLGQLDDLLNQVSDYANPGDRSSAVQLRTPLSLAWDGGNLYVSDPFNRRLMIFSVGDQPLPFTSVRNAASRAVYAVGAVIIAGTITANDQITVHIGPTEAGRDYAYKIGKDDKLTGIVKALVDLINAGDGDADVIALANYAVEAVVLTARASGEDGNNVAYSVKTSSNATIAATTSGANLTGGQNAAKIGPGSLVLVQGGNLTDSDITVPASTQILPRELGGVKVYIDGIEAPLYSVSPGVIGAQVPFEVNDATGCNAFVRSVFKDGHVLVTTPVSVPIVPQNPGIYAAEGDDPRPALAVHYSSFATGTVSVDGTAYAADTATVTIDDRSYTYTVLDGDTLENIRDGLVDLINVDPKVEAFKAGIFTRIRIKARVPGPEGNGIAIAGSASTGAQVIMTATNSALCCANLAGAPITEDNPAVPGETIVVFATGLGLVTPDAAQATVVTGRAYTGPYYNEPVSFVSSLAGAKTANVLYCGLKEGTVGIYEVHLELNSDLPTNPAMQLTIAQDVYVSNIVTIPIVNPITASSQ
jgi:hypothetical protein